MKKTNQQIEDQNKANQICTQFLTKAAKNRRRAIIAHIEQHAAPEQLESLDEQLSQLVLMAKGV